jgi:hypothetical protein
MPAAEVEQGGGWPAEINDLAAGQSRKAGLYGRNAFVD